MKTSRFKKIKLKATLYLFIYYIKCSHIFKPLDQFYKIIENYCEIYNFIIPIVEL